MGRPSSDFEPSSALALLERCERSLRRTAGRWSLCADDADDAFQRAFEILLTRASSGRLPGCVEAWMQVVVRNEALAVRRERERLLADAAICEPGVGEVDGFDRLPSNRIGPVERAQHRERLGAAARLLSELKPAERLAIVLHACGYSYAEIAAACGWTRTKVNRSLAEGRAKLRSRSRTGAELHAGS